MDPYGLSRPGRQDDPQGVLSFVGVEPLGPVEYDQMVGGEVSADIVQAESVILPSAKGERLDRFPQARDYYIHV